MADKASDRPEPTGDIEQAKADLDRHGFCILTGAIPAETAAAVQDRLVDQAAAERERDIDTHSAFVEPDDDVNQWVFMLPNKGDIFRELVNNASARALVGHVLGAEALLSDCSAHITWPGNKEMALHIDQWFMPQPIMPGDAYTRAAEMTRADQPFGDPEPAQRAINIPMILNVFWAISDFTVENGCTRLMPGSHLSGRHPVPGQAYDCVMAEAPAGSIVAWDGRTWHGASLNTGTAPRVGVTTYWGAPFLRQLMNFTYGLKQEVVEAFDDEERRTHGFLCWSSYGSTGSAERGWAQPGEKNIGELSVKDEK
ncbi:MAG: phytanoyl-CoA dioxygenase family protein [Alphaproteobacteria bacterium]|jgi:ectoine hydroxylase-related dioxygenase (phytanoyl-CoA dioxygenase family)|nr:hypothetical protein [Rhodospirillaceae bacterium]MBT7613081.1 hypothetical protein [Rhodospirillaceae bacterium]MDG2482271.1 phytanoyl-CoA dioxygenase family protein [Alphaproteobacteria bacterium]